MAWVGRFDDFSDLGYYGQATNKPNFQRRPASNRPSVVVDNLQSQVEDDFSSILNDDGKTPIANISTQMQSVSIAGVVIAREGPRAITSKKGSCQERHLLCLTLRDGPMSFVNVTCWGTEQYANFLHSQTAIGEVVEVKGARVQDKSNPADEKFKPWTPCPCQLNVSETNGCVSPYTGSATDLFARLLHMPTREDHDYCSLDDVNTNGINLQGEHVNVLALVKKIWPVRQITTKTGKKTSKVDVVLCDETCLAFNLTLWDSFVELTERWVPMETVIFASDVKIVYNDFRSTMAASSDSKSIFTSDPDIPEAHRLLNLARTHSTLVSDNQGDVMTTTSFADDNRDPDISTIKNVLTVREAKSLQAEVVNAHDGRAVFGVLHSFLSHFDLDGEGNVCVRNVCPKCHKTVQESTGFVCSNPACVGSDDPFERRVEFNMTVNFSDHTGTIEHCHLRPNVTEQLLGCKAHDFTSLAVPQKAAMKWMHLLEKSKAVIKIKRGMSKGNKAFVTVLALDTVMMG